jgi:hypothetical protein
MNDIEIKNRLDLLLKQLSTERSFDIAEKITAELSGLLNIKATDRFLVNISRVDAELNRFQLAPGFARQAAAYELPHEDNKPFDLKLFWIKKASKTILSWIVGLTPNFEDAPSNDYKNIGIDFVVPEACDSITILLSNRFKVRALELKDHITPTQLEIFSQWAKLADIDMANQNELKNNLHAKLWESFNFEPVNRKFYLELVEHFSILVRHLEKNLGRKPSVMFTTRLIGRLLFIWFLKKKNLLNANVDYFSVPDPGRQADYYKNQLEKLFFEVLNRNELERSNGDKLTPYLNGGLFDKSTTDFFGDPKLTFPNGYFNQLFSTLNKYNFTVDESSPEFQHVAIDPEMLGRIFESLLAEQIDENTGNSKKKATGAFYTPREIVSYMCEQSLSEYLKIKIPDSPDRDHRIDELLRLSETIFRDQDQNKRDKWRKNLGKDSVIRALDEVLILDPAVGSGAFPMGMLHLLVKVYSRLDPKFEKDISGLKRDILSRSLYGVDIEQTAIEICRLRAWLSLIVDIPEGDKVEPLPNLEFKFVCANTLIPLDNTEQASFFTDHNLKGKLIIIRDEYFKTSSKVKKEKLQKDYLKLTESASLFDNKKTQQLKSYKPFDISSSSEFYDPELMHGVRSFDIVIGNPPYVQIQKFARTQIQKNLEKQNYKTFTKNGDLYCLFYEQAVNLLKNRGLLVFITSNKWIRSGYGEKLREYFVKETDPKVLVDFGGFKVFDSATVDTNILITEKTNNKNSLHAVHFKNDYKKGDSITEYINTHSIFLSHVNKDSWFIGCKAEIDLKIKIETAGKPLKDWGFKIVRGIVSGLKNAFEVDVNFYNKTIESDLSYKKVIKPILHGREIGSYKISLKNKFLIFALRGFNLDDFPLIKSHLTEHKTDLEARATINSHPWYELQQPQMGIYKDFEKERIVYPDISQESAFALCPSGTYQDNTTYSINTNSKYILGILNSKLIFYYYKFIANTMGEKTVRYFTQYVEKLPIVEIENTNSIRISIESFVNQILTLKKQNEDADTKNLELQIDQLVYKLYALTPEEIKIVENSMNK